MASGIGQQLKAGCGLLAGIYVLYWVWFFLQTGGASWESVVPILLVIVLAVLYRRRETPDNQPLPERDRGVPLKTERLNRLQLSYRIALQEKRLERVLQATPPDSTTRPRLEDALVRVRGVSSALERTAYDHRGIGDESLLDESDADTIRSIDAALESSAETLEHTLSNLAESSASGQPDSKLIDQLNGAISLLERATNERARVLITPDDEAVLPTVSELLQGDQLGTGHESSQFTTLRPNDALSYEGEDYSVMGRFDWSQGARVWQTYVLNGGSEEVRLLVERGGTSLAIMRPMDVPLHASDHTVTVEGVQWDLADRGVASVTVTGSGGRRGGFIVGYRRYVGPGGFLWVEEWDEGSRTMLGKVERPESFDLWIR